MDWYPWGAEAFEKARRESKPVFLSIGYSTCHWCHVMEDESFSDAAIAQNLNLNFVPVKVDREERPDIDKIYMSYVIAVTGSGGWPMTVFLTPDAKPFYGGTYFPPVDRYGRPGLPAVLDHIAEAWKSRRDEIVAAGERAVGFLGAESKEGRGPVRAETLHAAWRQFASGFDEHNGGFGSSPKFPSSHSLSFLMRFHARTGETSARDMAVRTLEKMAQGGIYDHLGGGFHRYSVDAMWRVPHFEKMLYDQAMLLRAYAEAYALTGDLVFRQTARETAAYVLRDLRATEGGFTSAEDADSPDPDAPGRKREGAFYVWQKGDLDALLGDDAKIFEFLYGVQPEGNAPGDPQGEFTGQNILYRARTDEEAARAFGLPAEDIARLRARSLERLLEARAKRPRPHLDDKVLTDWNGLMIGALAYASGVFGEKSWGEAAGRAADFVLKTMGRADGRLWHRYRAGEAAIEGQIDDYAFLLNGLADLYEATWDERRLKQAAAVADAMIGGFWDSAGGGGFFMPAAQSDRFLITRPKEFSDGAVPSGNSMAALGLLRLGALTATDRFEDYGRKTLESCAETVAHSPTAFAQMLQAFDFALGPVYEVILAGAPADPELAAMVSEIRTRFLPSRVLLMNPPGPQVPLGGRATAYVCRSRVCDLPVSGLTALKELLGHLRFNSD